MAYANGLRMQNRRTFNNTNRSAPQSGIYIEPNNIQVVQDLTISYLKLYAKIAILEIPLLSMES